MAPMMHFRHAASRSRNRTRGRAKHAAIDRLPCAAIATRFHDVFHIRFVREPLVRSTLSEIAAEGFGDMIKAVVDVSRAIMVVGADLHSDEEAALLDDGSLQSDLWGVNLYPHETGDTWIEFDSMINVRPGQGNRSRGVDSEIVRTRIRLVLSALVRDS